MSISFNVSKFIKENKELVKKYLKKNTYDIVVPDFDVKATDYYQRSARILKSKVERPEYTELQKLEYIKCAKKVEYFTKKYIKITSVDDGIVDFDMYDYQSELLKKCARNRFVITLQARQSGKMLDLDTPILTPNGMVKNGDLKVGDTIYGRDGKPTKILFISEQRDDMKQYKITFDTGEVVYACGEHLWNIGYSAWNRVKDKSLHERTYKTDDIYELFKKGQKEKKSVSIKNTKPVEFDKKEVYIKPYLLGLWLGDGTAREDRITCLEEDYNDYINNLENVSSYRDYSYINRCGNFKTNTLQELRAYNLLKNKHIPKDYIYNSYEVRRDLIQGLMDSDGNCDQKGSCEFYQKDKNLCEDFKFILSTLGIKSRIREKIIDGQKYYTVSFSVSVEKMECFKLKRKLELQKKLINHRKNNNHYIKDMKLLDEKDNRKMQCIMVDNEDHLFLCSNSLIATHNTTVNAAYILWYNTFHSSKKTAILANKASQARSILARVKLSYEFLPNFLKQGVSVYNKGTVEFGNKSNMFAASSSSDSIRGESVSLLYIDECAFLRNDMEFYESTYPTISSGKQTRVLISSTPKGARGLFYKLWQESVNGMNDYVNHKVKWDAVPGRDKEWREEQIRNTSREQFDQEHNVVFKGSINSLISGHILDAIPAAEPIEIKTDLKIYKHVEENHSYVTICDVSKGLGQDYHAFIVVDVTQMPYEVVATYKNNQISTMLYPTVIQNTCLYYNNAMTLIELNNSGEEVANILFYDLEYENMLTCVKDRNRQKLAFGGIDRHGVTTSTVVKSIGCNTIKKLIEDNQIILNDEDLIEEFGTFVPKGKSFEADKGAHDDLVMTAVLFAWATTQEAFKEISNLDTRKILINKNELSVMPFGFIENDTPEIIEEIQDFEPRDKRFHGVEIGEVDKDDPFFDGF